MIRYSVQPRDHIFVKAMDIYLLLKTRVNIAKNVSKSLIGKYRQKLFDHAKQSTIDALKTSSKRYTQRIADATGGVIASGNANKITKISKTSQQNDLEAVTNDNDRKNT